VSPSHAVMQELLLPWLQSQLSARASGGCRALRAACHTDPHTGGCTVCQCPQLAYSPATPVLRLPFSYFMAWSSTGCFCSKAPSTLAVVLVGELICDIPTVGPKHSWSLADCFGTGDLKSSQKSIQQGGRAAFGILQAAPPVALRRSEPSSQLD